MNFFDHKHLWYGADYNPEQWHKTPEIWDEDIRLMKLAHLNLMAVGIFSWSDLEPAEGQFDFSFLDTIMDKLAAAGMYAALATPSAAPPPWMVKAYPSILRVDDRGLRRHYGVRQQHCATSPIYREKVARINRELAQRYADHPALALWHVSNEYGSECHCADCQAAFRRWLQEKYGTLDALNEAWWGSFWSHRYTDWEEISSPSSVGENLVSAQNLDWRRFVSDQGIAFFENEIAPLREFTPQVPVTTNFMNTYSGLDYQKFARHLDVASWDNYPEWHHGDNAVVAQKTAFIHDLYRGMRNGQPFLVMESTPSAVNWHRVNKLQRPGMLKVSALQGVAHGSDSMQYFQWRKGRGAHEKYHGAVMDHVGHEHTRVFREVAELGEVLRQLRDVAGTEKPSEVALLYDWENDWAIRGMNGFNNGNRYYQGLCEQYHAPLWRAGVSVVGISEEQDFSPYRLLIAPMLYMLKPGVAQRLTEYVEAGGTLVVTYMTGMVDENDLAFLGGFPGEGLRRLFGIWVEETDALYEGDVQSVCYNGRSFKAQHACDLIHAEGAQVLATYEHQFYAGTPAVTCNRVGKGAAYYVGFHDDGAFSDALIGELIGQLPLSRPLPVEIPYGVSVQARGDKIFVLNVLEESATLTLDRPYREVLTGQILRDTVTLPPLGAWVLQK